MPTPTLSNLDANQVLRAVYDDTGTGELRVKANIVANIAQTEVIIDHTNDSIAIGDGGGTSNKAKVNSSKELQVRDDGANALLTQIRDNQTDNDQKSQLISSSGTSATFTGTALDVNLKTTDVTLEIKDISGTTSMFSGTVGTTSINLPTLASTAISEVFIRSPIDQLPNTKRLLYSFDSGVTFFTLGPGEAITWPLKGSPTQIQIKGNIAAVLFEVILNRE